MGGEVNSNYSQNCTLIPFFFLCCMYFDLLFVFVMHCILISFLFLCCMWQHGGGVVVDNLGIEAGVLCCCNEPGIAPL